MKGKPSTFNRLEDVCAVEVTTHKLLTLVLNDSVLYASTTSPPSRRQHHSRRKSRRYPRDKRLGGSRSRYGRCGEKKKYIVESNHVYIVQQLPARTFVLYVILNGK
jgi:hypothetical protein